MSAEILRQAAALMRERATDRAVPQGRWFVDDDDPQWHVLAHDPEMPGFPFDVARDLPGDDRTAVGEHIASWHPAAALAVADTLDALAKVLDESDYTVESDVLPTWLHCHLDNIAATYLGESA